MKRVAMLAGALALGAANLGGTAIGIQPSPIVRAVPSPGKRNRVSPSKRRIGRSKYTPHQGTKESARTERSFMQPSFYHANGVTGAIPRSAPILCQMSKRQFESMQLAQAA